MPRTFATPVLLLAAALAPGCGDGNGGGAPAAISEQAVMEIPDGDGIGAAFGGEYESEVVTTKCSGACGPISGAFGLTYSLCDVGNVDEDDFVAEHDDGHFLVTADSAYFVQRLEGGIDKDGSFDIGGFSTENAGAFKATNRVEGTIDPSGNLDGTANAHMWGTLDGQNVDCVGAYDIRGSLAHD